MASYRKPAIAKGNRDSIQLTTDNSNFTLTRTKSIFPGFRSHIYRNFTLSNSNPP